MTYYNKETERDRQGIRPLYRRKGYEAKERKKKKARLKSAWYKPHDAVLFIPPTPKGELQNRLKEVVKQQVGSEMKVKIVERAGVKMRSILPGLGEEVDCGRNDCAIHTTGGRGNCRKEGVVYQGVCLTCEQNGTKSIYVGETGKSAYVRGRQHLLAIGDPLGKQNSNAFAKHIVETHNNEQDIKFRFNVIQAYRRPLERQVREGVEIIRAEADIMLNSKLDHYQPHMRRIAFTGILNELDNT